MVQNNINLQILLGLNCNFKCSHCINSSEPQFTKYDINSCDVDYLANLINKTSSITSVSFNGGEPLIYIREIISIKNKVKRTVKWNITTNGSILLKNIKAFRELLDFNFIISYDRFHEEYITIERFRSLLVELQKYTKNFKINFVYNDPSELGLIYEVVHDVGCEVIPTRLIKGGRNRSCSDVSNVSLKCPNISNEDLKITYVSGRGFTTCCGPLLFDKKIGDNSFFSDDINSDNDDYARLIFTDQFSKEFFQILSENLNGEICDVCFKTNELLEYLSNNTDLKSKLNKRHFIINNFPPKKIINKINTAFHVEYLYKLNQISAVSEEKVNDQGTDIYFEQLHNPSKEQVEDFKNFILHNYYEKNKEQYSKFEVEQFIEAVPSYFDGETMTMLGYRKGKVVSAITAYYFRSHPKFKEEIVQIGYWGYECSIVSKNEARLIKNKWKYFFNSILLKYNAPIVSIVDDFNESSNKYALKNNFLLTGLRLNQKL